MLQGRQYGPFSREEYRLAKLLLLDAQENSEKKSNFIIEHSNEVSRSDSRVKNMQQLYKLLDSLALAPDFHVVQIPFAGYPRNHEVIRGMDSVPLFVRSPVECMMYLLTKPEFKGKMDFTAQAVYNDMHQRVFSELSSGDWFHRTERLIPESGTLLPIVLYTDKTRLSVFGNVSAYPLYMTIGIVHRSVRKDDKSRILVALLPTFACPGRVSSTELSLLNHWLFHEALDIVFFRMASPYVERERKGMTYGHAEASGMYATGPDGKIRHYFPRVAYYVADWPEAKLVTSTRGGSTAFPCHRCYVPHSDMSDVCVAALAKNELRTAEQFFQVVQECEGMSEGATRKRLKDVSLKSLVCTPLRFMDFDPFLDGVVIERMHQVEGGLFEHMVDWISTYIEVNGGNNAAAIQQRLDKRLMAIPSFQGIKRFRNGVSMGSNVAAGEYRDLTKVILFCLPGLFGDARLDNQLTRVFQAYCHWYALLRKSGKTEHELEELGRLYEEFGEACGSVFRHTIYSKSKLNFPKFHQPAHYSRDIRHYGDYDFAERFEFDHKGLKSMWKNHSSKQSGGVGLEQVCRYLNRLENMARLRHHADTFLVPPVDEDVADTVEATKTLTARFLGKPTTVLLQTALARDEALEAAVLPKHPWLPQLAACLAEKGDWDAASTQVSLHNSVRLLAGQ
jgi:hypothetical protein